ncbi:peptidoglycan D,D-transpeptidase FtsI family protein [Pseudonocardia bannensis]|uniref:Penicillin-binding protein 2 n=1 Tax=Pseudonocardia bannensis TaxID=630973 RepID=A0A848DBU8_9PSEU|nr:penicillin-binding protein 2 [Pseudonocardia bannensis]NMH90058.1 penicillin-binding protein 2 [Pseudonocardia bannensis]
MNGALRRVGVAMMALMVILLASQTYVQVVKGADYRDDPRNRRVQLAEYSQPRGQISADGQLLASSSPTDDSFRYLREYPNGPAFAPVTGYFSRSHGSSGLERAAGPVLNGSDPRLLFHRLSDLLTGGTPTPGNVVTTIDPHVQQVAYDAMTRKGHTGAVVAIQPSTGAILGMVSTPSFDPNPLASHDAGVQKKGWSEADAADPRALTNRAIDETYPPGSTFKLVDLAAALQDGVTPATRLTAESRITLPGTSTTLENYDGKQCGASSTVSVAEALARSCNTAFASLAGRLGADRLRGQAEKFGFGQTDLQIPDPVVASEVGSLPDAAALAQSGIGQRDVRLTPLQNAEIVATIANGGKRMAPHLIKEVDGPDLSVIDRTEPQELDQAIPPNVAGTLRDLMVGSEQRTTGHGSIPGVTIASKTGTAEHGADPKATPPHTWYVAFAPAENPVVAVAVIVENGGDLGDAATGGSVASPIGRDVIAAALQPHD